MISPAAEGPSDPGHSLVGHTIADHQHQHAHSNVSLDDQQLQVEYVEPDFFFV